MHTEIKDGRGRRRVTTLLRSFLAKEALGGCLRKITRSRIPITGNCRRGLLEKRSGRSSGMYFAAAVLAPLINRVLSVSRARVLLPVKADIHAILYYNKTVLSSKIANFLLIESVIFAIFFFQTLLAWLTKSA